MSKSDTRVTIRFSEEEYQKIVKDSEGFKSLSDYIRTFLTSYPTIKTKNKKMPEKRNIFYQGRKNNPPNIKLSKMLYEQEKKTDLMLPDEEEYIEDQEIKTPARNEIQVGRNAPCPCGSGKKYKRCCLEG